MSDVTTTTGTAVAASEPITINVKTPILEKQFVLPDGVMATATKSNQRNAILVAFVAARGTKDKDNKFPNAKPLTIPQIVKYVTGEDRVYPLSAHLKVVDSVRYHIYYMEKDGLVRCLNPITKA